MGKAVSEMIKLLPFSDTDGVSKFSIWLRAKNTECQSVELAYHYYSLVIRL